MLNSLSSHLKTFQRLKFCKFSTQANCSMDIFPDQILSNLKSNINKVTEEELKEIEMNIVNEIHFFDADQYADMLVLLARSNKGSELLWDVISRKVYDYHFDYIQSEAMINALKHTYKCHDFIFHPLRKNLYNLNSNNDERMNKLYRSFYF